MSDSQTTKITPTTAPEHYWNRAGEIGYSNAMYSHGVVGNHVNASMRSYILEAAKALGLNSDSRILELGCGDGDLANTMLSKHFKIIEGHDLAPASIERANKNRQPNTTFFCSDITAMKFDPSQRWDAVFFIGILHHVKSSTPAIIERVAQITDRIVVMEPNGNHIGRKLLEMLPLYKKAGEDSFRRKNLEQIFFGNDFSEVYYKRFNLCPNFTPDSLYPVIKRFEPAVENSPSLDFLCTNQVIGFKKKSVTS